MQALLALFPRQVAEAVGWIIIHSVWQVALITAVVFAALHALRRRSADLRYLVASAGLVLATALPIATGLDATTSHRAAARLAAPPEVTVDASEAFVRPVQAVFERLDTHGVQALFTAETARRWLQPVVPWLFLFWLLGVTYRGSALVMGTVGVSRLRRTATPMTGTWVRKVDELARRLGVLQMVTLAKSETAQVPFVCGIVRPMVVLPASALTGIPTAHLEGIIAHELAHVRRHDYLVNLLQVAVETAFFYHPGVWWLSQRIRVERENCCDDLAAEVCYGPLSHARALARLEELRAAPALAVSATGGSLVDRIRRLVGRQPPGDERGATVVTGVLAAVSVALVGSVLLAAPPDGADLETEPRGAEGEPVRADFTTEQRRSLGRLGVDDDDIARYAALGCSSFSTLHRLAAVGLDPSDLVEFRQLGFIDADTVIRFAHHGVDARDIEAFGQAGLERLSASEILGLARHGVDPADAGAMRALLGDDATVERILALARYGIDADDIRAFERSGYDLSVDDIRRLARHGIDGDDLTELKSLADPPSVSDILVMHRHGLDYDELAELRRAGLPDLSHADALRLARHGVDADDVAEFRRAGLHNLGVSDILDLARHGIDGDDAARALREGRARGVPDIIGLMHKGQL